MDMNTDQPTIEDVKTAVMVMKNGNGSDRVTTEMLKDEDIATPRLLTHMFSDIWETENVPED